MEGAGRKLSSDGEGQRAAGMLSRFLPVQRNGSRNILRRAAKIPWNRGKIKITQGTWIHADLMSEWRAYIAEHNSPPRENANFPNSRGYKLAVKMRQAKAAGKLTEEELAEVAADKDNAVKTRRGRQVMKQKKGACSVMKCSASKKVMKAHVRRDGWRRGAQAKALDAIVAASGVGEEEVTSVLWALEHVSVELLLWNGKFEIPGIAMLKLGKVRPPRKGRVQMLNGRMVEMKAQPARRGVKCSAHCLFERQF